MSYLEEVVLASAVVATEAAEELSAEVEETASVDEEELSIEAADACWDGYLDPEYLSSVPSADIIEFLVRDVNSNFGSSRHIDLNDAFSVAKKAVAKYDYLPDEQLFSAVLWELHTFAEYATTGTVADGEDFSEYAEFTAAGHPDTEASVTAAATWVAGAPDLDNSGREALLTAFSEDSDYVKSLHASTRVRAMVSSGSLTEATLQQIKNLSTRYLKVN